MNRLAVGEGRVGHLLSSGALTALLALACGVAKPADDDDVVPIGAVLPFTGDEATIGQNLEQALLLAIEDVNRAGGIGGTPLRLVSRDSNSGSSRGLHGLLQVLYEDDARYLIGPEENELANEIVPDIKGLDVFNVLPGFASPSIERVTRSGAWLRLPPSPLAFGCGLSELSRQHVVEVANAVVAQDDFNQSVASEFITEFFDIGGGMLPSMTLPANNEPNATRVASVVRAGADRTLLIVNPSSASTIVTDWAVGGGGGSWLLGPTLHTPGFLQNVPLGSLDGTIGLSPTLSLASECEAQPDGYRGRLRCEHANADEFSAYYARRWGGDKPFPAAHFYYDAVVLLAMGLHYAAGQGTPEPSAAQLHRAILEMASEATAHGTWKDLSSMFGDLHDGIAVTYAGAAAEYRFDQFGAAKHLIFDTWRVESQEYVDEGNVQARCLRQPK